MRTERDDEAKVSEFEERFEELWAVAYRVAYRVLGDREEAADVAQDTLARICTRWSRSESYAPALTAKMAGDRAIDVWRRRRRVDALHVPGAANVTASPPPVDLDRAQLVAGLRRLPARQRHTVVLRYLADLSEIDTAAALGCSKGAVKQHASRGLAALRRDLSAAGQGA